MRSRLLGAALAMVMGVHAEEVSAAGFTYRGALSEQGRAAEGRYGFRLALYDAPQGGRRLGNEVTLPNVTVKAGAFEAPLDFGVDLVGYDRVFLAVEVQDASGAFTPIAERQVVQPKALEAGVCWATAGNAALATDFLGTSNAMPLVLKVNSLQVGEISPSANATPDAANVAFGSSQNMVGAGVAGATVAGGGNSNTNCFGASPNCLNAALKDFASVGGGIGNTAGGYASTVTGGSQNSAGGDDASVNGGILNVASGLGATVAGGSGNHAVGPYSAALGGAANYAEGYQSVSAGGTQNYAGGDYSFAAGYGAYVRGPSITPGCAPGPCGDHGTFIWADDNNAGGSFASSGPDQFMVRAAGGVAINGKPINNQVELSIYPSSNGSNYANILMRQLGTGGGVLLSSGDATGSTNNAGFYIDRYDGTNQVRELSLAGNGDFSVSANAYKPGGGSWSAPSDARLKTNVQPLSHALDRMLLLRGVSYEYSHPDGYLHPAGEHVGFIAQEVERVFPEWVGHSDDGYLTVGPKGFEALTVEALRDLRAEQDEGFDAMARKSAALAEENRELRARLARIEARLGASDGGR